MAQAPTVLVTGGTGVVGTAVVRRLVEGGRRVRGLARSAEAERVLRDLGAQPVPGDIRDVDALERAMRGCDVAYHVAGMNRFCLRDPSPMRAANVTGSANCVVAASRAGVQRLVYTSSAVTLGEARGTVGREDVPHRGAFLTAYERSKFDAEQVVLRLAERRGVEVVCVNPSSVQGPGRTSGTGRMLVEYLRGRFKLWVDTVLSLVDVDDCAEGHVLAETKGEAGRRYILNAASLGSDEVLALLAHIAPGVARPRLVPPAAATVAIGGVAALARLRGQTPIACRESAKVLRHGHRYDGSRAERELGLRYRPVEETLRRTAAWLVAQGLAPASALVCDR